MESNRWAICMNLNNLKEFDDLFENKEEIMSQTGTDYNNFLLKDENISSDTIKIWWRQVGGSLQNLNKTALDYYTKTFNN